MTRRKVHRRPQPMSFAAQQRGRMPGGGYIESRITRVVCQHGGRREGFEPSPKELPVERSKHRAAIKSVQMRLDLFVQPGAQLAHLRSMSPDVGNDHTRHHVMGADRKVIHVPTLFTAARQGIYARVYPVGTDIKVGVAVTAPDFRATNWVRNR